MHDNIKISSHSLWDITPYVHLSLILKHHTICTSISLSETSHHLYIYLSLWDITLSVHLSLTLRHHTICTSISLSETSHHLYIYLSLWDITLPVHISLILRHHIICTSISHSETSHHLYIYLSFWDITLPVHISLTLANHKSKPITHAICGNMLQYFNHGICHILQISMCWSYITCMCIIKTCYYFCSIKYNIFEIAHLGRWDRPSTPTIR